MKCSSQFEHFAENAGWHLDPSLINETSRDYNEWPSILKSLSFTDPELVNTLASQAGPTLQWLKGYGIKFSDMATYLLTQNTTRICPVGGGLALVETLASEAEKLGVDFLYETTASDFFTDENGEVCGVKVRRKNKQTEILNGKINYKGKFATEYSKLPLCNPDFIYLDGPDQYNIKKSSNNFTTAHPDLMPMVADILKMEYFLLPGTIMLIDGRGANASFLRNNLERKWGYKYLEKSYILTKFKNYF